MDVLGHKINNLLSILVDGLIEVLCILLRRVITELKVLENKSGWCMKSAWFSNVW